MKMHLEDTPDGLYILNAETGFRIARFADAGRCYRLYWPDGTTQDIKKEWGWDCTVSQVREKIEDGTLSQDVHVT